MIGPYRGLAVVLLTALSASATAQTAEPQGQSKAERRALDGVVPYCIEPMESMPQKIRALIDAQYLCAPGTHLKRDSRQARVIPTGEEKSGRPFVLRFEGPETANAWFVRGYAIDQR